MAGRREVPVDPASGPVQRFAYELRELRAAAGGSAVTILTGGYAPLFAGQSPLFDHVDTDLTVDGLRMI